MTLAVLLIPLLTAGVLVFVSERRMQRGIALLSAIATFIAAVLLPGAAAVELPWIADLGIWFSLDPTGAASVLVVTAALAILAGALYASYAVEERTGIFLALLFGMQAALNGVFLAKDLVMFYVFWELALVPSLFMLGLWGGERRRQAVMKYLIYALAGSFLMLIGILAIKPLSGAESYRIADLLAATGTIPMRVQVWMFIGFAAAFAVKLPLIPVHSWLIDFHEQNHPSGAADLAGTLYKVGGFGFFAWAIPLLPKGAEVVAPILLVLAAITALYAALVATQQTHLKKLLAYASLAHMGIVGVGVFGLGIMGFNGAMYLLAAQMLSTGGLFLLAGMLYARHQTFDVSAYGGLAKSAPALAAITLFVIFTSVGVPGLANFPGEFLALLGAFDASIALGVIATLSVIAAGAYGVNLYQRIYQGKAVATVADIRPFEVLVIVPLLAGILWLGIAPAPQFERIEVQSAIAVTALDTTDTAAPDPGVVAMRELQGPDPGAVAVHEPQGGDR